MELPGRREFAGLPQTSLEAVPLPLLQEAGENRSTG